MNVAMARFRTDGWRRVVILLIGVPAVLLCLIGMHVVVGVDQDASGLNSSGTAHAMVAMVPGPHSPNARIGENGVSPSLGIAAIGNTGLPTSAQNCDGACDPMHDMANMACALAVAVSVVLVTLHLILVRGGSMRLASTAIAARAAALAPPVPPSLHVLSISRT